MLNVPVVLRSSCGDCTLCCTLLEVEEIDKPFITECKYVRKKGTDGCGQGCSIYAERPEPCQHFSCLWLASQIRTAEHEVMPPDLRPDQCHVVLGPPGTLDRNTLFIHVDPKFPDAWLQPKIQDFLAEICNRGAFAVVCIDKKRIILKKGQEPLYTTEEEIAQMRLGEARREYPSTDRVRLSQPQRGQRRNLR